MTDITRLRWLRERVGQDQQYKLDQIHILEKALDNLDERILYTSDFGDLSRRKRQRAKVADLIDKLRLELRALEVHLSMIERDLWKNGETYALLSGQWRAVSDRQRHK